MARSDSDPRPPLASADCRTRARPMQGFSRLVRNATDDPHAATEFVRAYATLSSIERRALREAVAMEGAHVGPLLACLDAIETDSTVAPRWRAWHDPDGGIAVGAPEVGMLEVRGGRVGIRDACSPREGEQPLDVERAVDVVAEALWRDRRAGTPWPEGAARFAALFDPRG